MSTYDLFIFVNEKVKRSWSLLPLLSFEVTPSKPPTLRKFHADLSGFRISGNEMYMYGAELCSHAFRILGYDDIIPDDNELSELLFLKLHVYLERF